VPFRLIFDRYLDENLALALFCFGGLLWSLLLLNLLMTTYTLQVPFWMKFLAVLCLGLSNIAPYMLRRPLHYEVGIASGYFFLFGSLYWLISAEPRRGEARRWRLILGGLFLGLAVGSRPHLLVAGIIAIVLCIRLLRVHKIFHPRQVRRDFIYMFVPFSICLGLLGLYNYARFDSWTEFGQRYALGGINLFKWQKFDPLRIPVNLYFYFLAPSRLDWNFPFFHLAPNFPPDFYVPKGYYGPEPVAGVLTNSPFLNILFLSPLFFRNSTGHTRLLGLTFGSLIVSGLAVALVVSAHSATMRYAAEFVSLLLLPALLVWFSLDQELRDRTGAQAALRTLAVASILYGCLFNVAISITGAQDVMKRRNPATYRAIERVFYPHFLTRYLATRFGPVALKMSFSSPKPGAQEPLVVTGRSGAGDFAFVKYLGDHRIALGFDHWGGGGPMSAPVHVRPDTIYEIEIHMGSLYPSSTSLFSRIFPDASQNEVRGLVLLKFNGTEVLRARSGFHYSAPSEVTIGQNRIGGGVSTERFSGQILAARRTSP